ncbi:MAG: hypothetical protein HP497_10980 [Nitrospira sp.]|nr:hypothetical protein [Nitrospira sp.]
MRYSQLTVGAKSLGLMALCALASFGFATASEAGSSDPKPKTVVETTTSVDSSNHISLNAFVKLMQMSEDAADPYVSTVKLWLQEHKPTSSGTSGWVDLPSTLQTWSFNTYFGYEDELYSTVDVMSYSYDVCNHISPSAVNSIRAVAIVQVLYATKGGTASKDFLGRSISVANTCPGK